MKCEKCNQNEASVFYRASINGQTTEQHLCAHCAEELGLDKAFNWPSRNFFGDAFGGFFGRDPFESFFGGSLLPGFVRQAMAPVGLLTRTEPQAAPETKTDSEWNARRELNALRSQLDAAVKAEDFEKAIELRDKIRTLEKQS